MGGFFDKGRVWEDGDRLYIVTPLAPFGPGQEEIQEYAFSKELLSYAPNDNLLWLKGAYAEADNPNANGQMWTSNELALKSLTPRLMPVTVMHDPRTAVGLIADARLLVPDKDQVPRARIETSLAVWKHRFPEVAEEVQHNYEQGSLMQSMECVAPHYSCEECGKTYPKLPDGAEREQWCSHLKGENADGRPAGRILGNVVFTGTGLIFGTRGSRGAYSEAHLDVFQSEVAAFHAEAHGSGKPKQSRSQKRMDTIEITKSEYAELQKRVSADDFETMKQRAEAAETAKAEAERNTEAAEQKAKDAETAKDAAEKKLKDSEETANAAQLSDERMGKLGEGFKEKLADPIKAKLAEQAKTMSDTEWDERLEELSSLVKVKPDAGKENEGEETPEDEFSEEEIASAGVGKERGEVAEPSSQARKSVFEGLSKTVKAAA